MNNNNQCPIIRKHVVSTTVIRELSTRKGNPFSTPWTETFSDIFDHLSDTGHAALIGAYPDSRDVSLTRERSFNSRVDFVVTEEGIGLIEKVYAAINEHPLFELVLAKLPYHAESVLRNYPSALTGLADLYNTDGFYNAFRITHRRAEYLSDFNEPNSTGFTRALVRWTPIRTVFKEWAMEQSLRKD